MQQRAIVVGRLALKLDFKHSQHSSRLEAFYSDLEKNSVSLLKSFHYFYIYINKNVKKIF